ncbi:glycosyltransferase [Rhodococcoides yunnanense]|uniref:4,4'-diaponeurosporenoate glycosyltransferase n=1 Tax=Rhodococcoides yunnanense TaxID=278209 RepID=A0ABU4B825_9NOCA|nr:glycosyltransferase [Rhodococcus yunnanensis]MDV6260306.1 glycosyltransferase [Rhodococcus yunnanensis]
MVVEVSPRIPSRTPVCHIVVVVPAHNEQDLLDACLTALSRAERRVVEVAPVTVSTIVVLDACTDDSASIAARHPSVSTVTVEHRNVGAARAAGFSNHTSELAATTWFATTDADTRVGEDWLLGHLRHATDGARAVAGTVSVEFEGRVEEDVRLRSTYDAHYRHELGHPHVHGANLGIRATDYLSVGGFAPLATGEDHDLVRRLELGGIACRRVCDISVTTSGRLRGRAPEGMAEFLRSLEPSA